MIDYDPQDWDSHLFDVRGSMVREILGRVMIFVAWSAVVVLLYQFPFLKWIAIPSIVHSLVGVALGLLLIFRTNAAYDRFWEGRKLWGSITNESRNLLRAASVLLRKDPDRFRQLVYWVQVFPFAVVARLRDSSQLSAVAGKLPVEEIKAVAAAPSPPLAVATRLTAILASAKDDKIISSYEYISLDSNVQQLVDYFGGCERIENTPLPYPYMVHLRRALILYCLTLPFALVREFGWGTILDTLIVTYIFFGIEEIGVEIGDPFGHDDNDLPLEVYCRGIGTVAASFLPSDPDNSSVVETAPENPTSLQEPIPLD
jgi:putative membrane protein